MAILTIVARQVLLNVQLTAGPNWLLPTLEAALLVLLSVVRSVHLRRSLVPAELAQGWWPPHGAMRVVAFGLIALLNLANLASLLLLVESLLLGSKATGLLLLINALNIWFINIIVYALWSWELDRGGPLKRQCGLERAPDLLFSQMSMAAEPLPWRPAFIDYLFVSFTDTLPLTPNVKVLTIALVASRAVNILASAALWNERGGLG